MRVGTVLCFTLIYRPTYTLKICYQQLGVYIYHLVKSCKSWFGVFLFHSLFLLCLVLSLPWHIWHSILAVSESHRHVALVRASL